MDTQSTSDWHHLTGEEVCARLGSDPGVGLAEAEVVERRRRYGPNLMASRQEAGPWRRFALQFHQPLLYILLASAGVTALLKEWVDAGVIFGVVLVNAGVGYLQEAKAVGALASLARRLRTEATVLRQGRPQRLAASELVPGDIVLVSSGDKVPADLRLLTAHGLAIDESALTGESLAVDKLSAPLAADIALADRRNMAYASTLVRHGQGRGLVVATGDHSELGRISRLVAEAGELATPLSRRLSRFSRLLLYLILGLALLTMAVGLARGQAFGDMFMAAVALAVGAIPEGLPAAVTVTLAIGVSRMAARRAIIRKLPAAETLGSTTVICSDKTGTLTENRMTVQRMMAGGIDYQVSGAGYDPTDGRLTGHGQAVAGRDNPALLACLLAGVLCNDSRLVSDEDGYRIEGDPTEAALLVVAAKAGLDLDEAARRWPRFDTLPFDAEQRYMATLHQDNATGARKIVVKGAVEAVTARCDRQLDASGAYQPMAPTAILAAAEKLAARGLRVLALAEQETAADGPLLPDRLAGGLVFLGLMAMLDPPRSEAMRAVRVCQAAGIRVVMITGDHAATAAAIADEFGLAASGPRVIDGRELARMSGQDLRLAAETTAVFARVAPEQKLRLVEALQAAGQVVAMTGDGVNDAPALKQADLGIAMGVAGTEVAKEAADMVLTDDNFTTIEAAIEEGRGLFDNLTKFIVWTLPTNLAEGLVILVAILLGLTLPILPVQILWINLTTAGCLGLMLAFEPKEPGIMQRPPRDPKAPLLGPALIRRLLLVSGLLVAATFALFHWELARGTGLAPARTVAVNVFVAMELCYLFNCRSLTLPLFRLAPFSNPWLLVGAAVMAVVQLAYTYLGPMQHCFQSAAIDGAAWVRILFTGLATCLLIEAEKHLTARRRDRTTDTM